MVGCSAVVSLEGLAGGTCGTDCDGDASPYIDASPGLNQEEAGTTRQDAQGGVDARGGAVLPDSGSAGTDGGAPPIDAGGPPDAGGSDTGSTTFDAAVCTPPTPTSLDDCTGIVAMGTPPVIDGALDCGVALWPMPLVAAAGPGPLPPGLEVSIAAAWRPNGLYVYVEVSGVGATRYPAPTSAPAWCGDAVEIYADSDGVFASAPTYDDPGSIQLVAVSPAEGAGPLSVGEGFRDTSDVGPWTGRFVSVAKADGFATEALLSATDLGLTSWSLAQGGKIGFDVAIDVGASNQQPASCPRLGQVTIQLPVGTSCGAACNVSEFCTPHLD